MLRCHIVYIKSRYISVASLAGFSRKGRHTQCIADARMTAGEEAGDFRTTVAAYIGLRRYHMKQRSAAFPTAGAAYPGGVDYISGQDQKWWPAAAGIAVYGSNHAGFTVWLKVIFLLNIAR